MSYLDQEHRRDLDLKLKEHAREEKNQLEVFSKQSEASRKHYEITTAQQNAVFKQRLDALSAQHSQILNKVQHEFNKSVNEIKDKTAKEKDLVANRSVDQFYNITELNPTLTENEKEYIVSIQIPEHEKDDVELYPSERQIRLTVTRRYDDNFTAEDGSLNRTKRSEVISKTFPTSSLMNSKKVSKMYEDQTLHFKIAKM